MGRLDGLADDVREWACSIATTQEVLEAVLRLVLGASARGSALVAGESQSEPGSAIRNVLHATIAVAHGHRDEGPVLVHVAECAGQSLAGEAEYLALDIGPGVVGVGCRWVSRSRRGSRR